MRLIQSGIDGIKKKGYVNQFINKNMAKKPNPHIVDNKQNFTEVLPYEIIANKTQEITPIARHDTVLHKRDCCWYIYILFIFYSSMLITKLKYKKHFK